MVQKKRKSKRLTSRQAHKLQIRTKKLVREQKKAHKKRDTTQKVPAHILRTQEEQEAYEVIRRGIQLRQDMHSNDEQKVQYKHVEQVIVISDVILYVVDARDIQGSRNMEVEQKM